MDNKTRIEKDAFKYSDINEDDSPEAMAGFEGYIAGATAEQERTIELCIGALVKEFPEYGPKEFSVLEIRRILEALKIANR